VLVQDQIVWACVSAHLSREAMQLFGICFDHFNKLSVQNTVGHENAARREDVPAPCFISCEFQRCPTPISGLPDSEKSYKIASVGISQQMEQNERLIEQAM
jgi:hypothetical protein